MGFDRVTVWPDLPADPSMTTLKTVKLELGLTKDTDDTYLARQIARASERVISYCRQRTFVLQAMQDTFRQQVIWYPEGSTFYGFTQPIAPSNYPTQIALSRWPVVSIASMVADGVTLVEGTDFEADYPGGVLFALDGVGNRTSWYFTTGIVDYTAGWVMPTDAPSSSTLARTLPYDLEEAVIDIVRAKYHARSRDPALRSQSNPQGGETQYQVTSNSEDGDLPMGVAGKLQPYRAVMLS